MDEQNKSQLKGQATIEKPKKAPLRKRIIDYLFSSKIDDMFTYLLKYTFGPAVRQLGYNLVVNAAQMAILNGNPSGQQPTNTAGYYQPGRGYISASQPFNYNAMSTQYSQALPQPANVPRNNVNSDYRYITFGYKDDAQTVIDRMRNLTMAYQRATIRALYENAGLTPPANDWTIDSYGWRSVEGAHPMITTDGRWMIEWPPIMTV